MKLFHIIANAQSNRAITNMGESFGFSDEVMARTVRYFIPPITKAIERRAQTTEGLLSVLDFLGSRRYDRFLDDPRIFQHSQVLKEGERALDYLFERETRIKKIVDNRAKVLPIDQATLSSMFPYLAVLILGAIEMRTRRPLAAILHRATKGATDSRAVANPYLALAQYLMKLERDQKERRRRRFFVLFGAGASPAREHKVVESRSQLPAIMQSA